MGTESRDDRISKILQLVCQLTAYDPAGDLDGLLERLTTFVEQSGQAPLTQNEKRIEMALHDSEERFRAAFMNANVGMALIDLQGRYVKVNDVLCQIFGYSRDELERMRYQDITYGDDQASSEQARQRVIEAPGQIRFHKRYVHKDGHIVWTEVSTSLLRDGAGQPLYFIGHIQDITSQKLAEEALREGEANARAFQVKLKELQTISLELTAVESAEELCRRAIELGHTVLGYDRLGLLLFDNPEKSRVSRFGIESTGELRVQTGMAYQVQEDFGYSRVARREEVYVNENADLGDFEGVVVGRGWNVLVGLWDAQASLGWLAADNFFTKTPLMPYQVELLTLYGLTLGHLVTRKRAEAALRQSEFFLQKSQTVGRIGSYYLDAKTGNWISSPMLDTLFGIEDGFPKNIEGWISLIHPEHKEEMRRHFGQHVLTEHQRFDKEYRIMRQADRQERWVHGLGELEFDDQGNVLAMIGTIQDITERKLAEEALRRLSRRDEEALRVAHMGYWEFDTETRTFAFNDQYYALHGMTAAEAGGYHMPAEVFARKYVHPADAHLVAEVTRQAAETTDSGFQYQTEARILRADGEVRDVTVWFRIQKNAQGHTTTLYGVNQDITERKQAERTLRASEDRLVKAQVLAHVGNWEIDLRTQATWGSEEALRIYGLDLSQSILPLSVIQACALSQYRAPLDESLRRLVAGTHDYAVDFQIHRYDDGALRYIHSTAECAYDESGKPVRILGVVQDVTESKSVQAQLETTLSLQEAAFEASADGVLVVDMAGHIITFNRNFAEMWHIPDSVLALREDDQTLRFVTAQVKNPEVFLSKIRNLYNQPDAVDFDSVEFLDGRVIERYSQPQRVGNQIVGRVWNFRDITERKQAEETLQRSERKYRMLFENMTAGFAVHEILYDAQGRPIDFRYLEVNPAFEKITGLSAAQVIGKTIKEMLFEVEPRWIEICNEVARTGKPIVYENYAKALDRYYDTGVFCPSPGQFAVTFFDITERKRAEAAILKLNQELEQRVRERTAELETANEEIKNFAYIVSHDLRAPLVNLKGFSAELRAALKAVDAGCAEILPLVDEARRVTMSHALQEDIPEALQYIESSVTRMDGLIKAILRLSRLGRQPFELVEVDVRSLVDKTLETLAFQINTQNVRVTVGSLPTVIGDRVSLEQIFGNILTNAVAYLLPGRPGQIEIGGEQTAHETSFSVRDNGRGIAPDDMGNVFAPFRRAGKQDVPGEGMGLAYVQTLVRRHGGRIWCESALGVGTTFTFTISRRLKMNEDRA